MEEKYKTKAPSKSYKPSKFSWKKQVVFFIFLMSFTAVSMLFLIFYGPFSNVKSKLVGTLWNTYSLQFIDRMFLSDKAISRIVGSGYAIDPSDMGIEVQQLEFGVKHTDRITVDNIDGGDFKGKVMTIYDPTKVVVGYSLKIPKSGETTSTVAKRNGAVAAINAGGFMDVGWAGTGGAPMGFIIHDGEIVYDYLKNENTKQDVAAFTDKGMLIVGKHSLAQLRKFNVKEAVSFGPPLIVNGKPTITRGDGGWGINPRTAIGQREDGAVIFVVIDGRSLSSIGATLKDVQGILLQYKAVNAVNLDGGSSATMFYNGKLINTPSDALGERAVPSVFMVIPPKEGAAK